MKRIVQGLYKSAHVAGHAASAAKTWQRNVSGLAQDSAQKSPSRAQLRAHALQSAVPMIGFGVVDCVVMTQVGSTMDAVLGARLGISSITAAAIGLFCSDSCGVLFGGTIESFAGRLGLPTANLTSEQLEMPETKRVATLGRLVGVQLGVLLGSTTLLLQGGGDADKNSAQETACAADLPSHLAATAAITTAADVVVFSKPGCPFCEEAENMLLASGVAFRKVPHDVHQKNLQELTSSTAAPSIWMHGKYVGNKYIDGGHRQPSHDLAVRRRES
ncbi:TMEM65 [Symbiodinium microadriaticum]|nr:TMEM65 [Symbiodinium microadriaticum]